MTGRLRQSWPGCRPALLAALAGLAAATGQEPLGWWWLALLGYAGLIRLVAVAQRGAGWIGLFGGAAHFAVALSWIVEPFLIEPEVYGWMAPFALMAISFGLALFWGGAALVARKIAPFRADVVFAITLTLAEMARGHVLTGFPWALPGHIWMQTPLLQIASLMGAYGLTLLTLIAGAGLARLRRLPLAGVTILVAAGWGWGLYILSLPGPAATDVTLRLTQPNAAQHLKWDRDLAAQFFDRLMAYTAIKPAPDLVIWPETALPYSFEQHPELRRIIAADAGGAPVALGAQRATGALFWNSLTVIGPGGVETARYDKHHLVPFGEYIPAGDLMYRLFGLRAFASQVGAGYSAGSGPAILDLGPKLGKVLPLICYEVVFPQDIRAAPGRAGWMLQITNDAWFGTLSGPFQHAALARMRAVEMGLPLVRVANTGVTAIYDARGRTMADLPFGTAGYLDAILPGPLPPTLYVKAGEIPVLVLLFGLLALFLVRRRKFRA